MILQNLPLVWFTAESVALSACEAMLTRRSFPSSPPSFLCAAGHAYDSGAKHWRVFFSVVRGGWTVCNSCNLHFPVVSTDDIGGSFPASPPFSSYAGSYAYDGGVWWGFVPTMEGVCLRARHFFVRGKLRVRWWGLVGGLRTDLGSRVHVAFLSRAGF